jgi:RNA 2',3'-cyclic 3'-phosphodiesterase
MPRLFLGLELPEDIRAQLVSLSSPISGAKWHNAGQLHLTLHFIGAFEQSRVPALVGCLQELEAPGFEIRIHGAGQFGRAGKARTLWAGVEPEAPLQALKLLLVQRLATVGIPPEDKPFQSHITLARFGRSGGRVDEFIAEHSALTSRPFAVTHVSLFESVSTEEAVRYPVLERFALLGSE